MLTRDQILDIVGKTWWENGNILMDFIHHHLSREGAKVFTKEHCAFAARFPQWFGNIIGNCPHLEVSDPTIDEGHYESLVKFGVGLGLTPEEILNYEPMISMQMAFSYWDHTSRTKPWVEAFAAIGGLELVNHGELAARYGEKPVVSVELWAPLNLPREAMTHWIAAEAADPHEVGHGEETVRILCKYTKTVEQARAVLATLKQGLSVFRYQYDQIGKAAIEVFRKPTQAGVVD